ncbi:MAG TPA: sugar epimerase, partial [Candidatus Eisenbacteria bacterium]|nr:sugar epimerase [Candidatus Eisenbacteria bacterium]
APMMEVWQRRAFCPLGEGDLALDAVLEALKTRHYQGWLVVEQDIIPAPGDPADRAARDQVRNRAFLRARGV